MIDIHSHILSRVDDGAKSMDISLAMLRQAEERGTSTIVATPHYIRGIYESSYRSNYEIYTRLKEQALEAGLSIHIILGQEVMLDNYSIDLCKGKVIQGINETDYILVELPMNKMPREALELIYELRVLGYIPILAHPERYSYIHENLIAINDFIKEGCLFQINTGSILGQFGSVAESCSKRLIKSGIANFIASDAHSLNNRPTGLREAFKIAETLDKSIIENMENNSRNLLKNKQIKVDMEPIKKKKSISFFRNK